MATLASPALESILFPPAPEPEICSNAASADRPVAVPSSPPFLYDLQAVESGIPLEALTSFVAESGLPMKDVLGAVIPLRTLKHRRARGEALNTEESDKLARVVRLFRFTLEVFGDRDKAVRWFTKPKMRFDDRTPISLLRTELGGSLVEQLLWQIADGMFA